MEKPGAASVKTRLAQDVKWTATQSLSADCGITDQMAGQRQNLFQGGDQMARMEELTGNPSSGLTVETLIRGVFTLEQGGAKKVFSALQKGLENLVAQNLIAPSVAKEFRQMRAKKIEEKEKKMKRIRDWKKSYKGDNPRMTVFFFVIEDDERKISVEGGITPSYFCSGGGGSYTRTQYCLALPPGSKFLDFEEIFPEVARIMEVPSGKILEVNINNPGQPVQWLDFKV